MAEGVARSAALKLSQPKYDSNGLLDKSCYLTEEEKNFLMGFGDCKTIITVNNDIYAEPSVIVKK